MAMNLGCARAWRIQATKHESDGRFASSIVSFIKNLNLKIIVLSKLFGLFNHLKNP
jgi:hypothetical protein